MNHENKGEQEPPDPAELLLSDYAASYARWLAAQPSIEECLPLSRAQAVAFTPSQLSEAERHHLTGCEYCSGLVTKFRERLHPSMADVLMGAETGEASVVGQHVKNCDECGSLRRSHLLQGALSRWRAGMQPVHSLAAMAAQMISGSVLLPARAEAFGEARPGVGSSWAHDGLTVAIEAVDTELLVTATCEPGMTTFDRVSVRLHGERVTREFDIELTPAGGIFTGGKRIDNEWGDSYNNISITLTALPWHSTSRLKTEL